MKVIVLSSRQELILSLIPLGEENAVHGRELQAITDMPVRALRAEIESIRRAGIVICGSNAGYFKPADLDEVRRHIRRQRKAARSVLFTLRSARQLEKELALQSEFEQRLDVV